MPPIARLAPAISVLLLLSSCSSAAPDGHKNAKRTDEPLVTGEPAGNNAGDVAFAHDIIARDQQGLDISANVSNRSANPKVVRFASQSASVRGSDIATLKVLLVQWSESPNAQSGNDGHGATPNGVVDPATIARLNSLHGGEFDTLWFQSMISVDQSAIGIANAEMSHGMNVDAVSLSKQIVEARQAEIGQMNTMFHS